MDEQQTYLSTTKAGKYFGVSRDTLQRWEDEGAIKCFRTKPGFSGHKRYDVKSFNGIREEGITTVKKISFEDEPPIQKGVCYCRVSTRSQADDLNRQVEAMQEQYPTFKIIKDFGSKINFKRKGLLKLLQGAIEGDFSTVVVSHRDRLTRFGFELFEWIFGYYRVKLVVLEQSIGSKESELCKDLMSIVHVFSCRASDAKRYKKKETDQDPED